MRLTTAVVNGVVFFLTTVVVMATDDQTLRYNVSEEVDPGTVVGDFKGDYYASRRAEGYDLSALRFNFRSPSTHFRIDSLTGVIVTSRRVDREQLCGRKTQSCDVIVVDVIVTPTDRFVIVKVRIAVIDINDHAPTFPVDEMALDVWDNSPLGALYSIPYADDADSGVLGVQRYSLEGARDKFDLKVTDMLDGSHDVRLQLRERLNAEAQRGHNLTVVARDGGIPPRSGTLVVRVTVRSMADVRPKFEGVYTASVVENCPLGRWVVQVQATSAGNQQVVYGLVDGRPEASDRKLFRIDPRSGSVYVSGSVDYETYREHHVTVSAAVNGRPALTAVTSLTIEVVDVNDNAPEIAVNTLLRSGRGQVTENAPNGTFVAHVIVTDPDSGDNSWTACLTNSALFLLEELSPTEYKLTTTVTFDREEEIQHKVKVVCHDFGTPSLTSSVPLWVDVLDQNDNDPKFSRPEYTVTDSEDVAPDSVLVRVSAFDADDGSNARLTYSLTPLAPTPIGATAAIAIDDVTGDVRATAPLDYESGAQYRFLVTATDSGTPPRSGSATLTLNLIDCNDGVPTFTTSSSSSSSSARSGYLFRALVDRPPGSVVGRVEATDTDATDVHRKVTYSLEGSREVPFQVDPLTGWIRSGRVLAAGEVYGFLVRASNSLSPVPLTAVANVTVVVNRTLPSLLFPTPDNHTVTLNLDSVKVGDVIAEVRVDQGLGDDNDLRYGLEKSGDGKLFHLEERTGSLLLVKEPLPGQGLYRLSVTVSVDPDAEFKVTGRLDVKVTASSSALIGPQSWMGTRQKLMTLVIGVIVGVIGVIVVVIFVVVIFLRLRRAKTRRGEYNCRYEANRPRGRVKVHDSDVMSDYSINQNGVLINNSLKQKVATSKKKEVTFALDDVDDDVAEEDKMLDIYKENQFIYNKSSVKCSSDALLNSPEDNDSIGSDSGKGASEEGDSSAPGHRYAPRAAHHAPHSHSEHKASAKATSPQQSSASNSSSSKVTRVNTTPPMQPNTRIPPPPPRPLDREPSTTPNNPVAMVTFKGSDANPLHSSAPGEYSCVDHQHSPGGASNNASRLNDEAHFVEFATDV